MEKRKTYHDYFTPVQLAAITSEVRSALDQLELHTDEQFETLVKRDLQCQKTLENTVQVIRNALAVCSAIRMLQANMLDQVESALKTEMQIVFDLYPEKLVPRK